MKTYKGTKIVNAEPMDRLTYNKLRGWELPADEDGTDEGYLVEYTDGGKANMPQYSGYVSWSPKDVFERAYKPVESLTIKQRVERERQQVSERFAKLSDFIFRDPRYAELSEEAQKLLVEQSQHMGAYISVLGQRLDLLEKESTNV